MAVQIQEVPNGVQIQKEHSYIAVNIVCIPMAILCNSFFNIHNNASIGYPDLQI